MQKNAQKLALGTAQFGLTYGVANKLGKITHDDGKAMLKIALANNIDTLDTAIAYGDSEACLGEIGTQGFNVVTKLPRLPIDCGDLGAWVANEVQASLDRLRVPNVYGLLLHHPEQLLGQEGVGIYKKLLQLKDDGLVQKIGISIYSPTELTALYSQFRFDLVQAPFSLIDQRLHSSGWLRRLKESGIEVHTRSTFLQGLLLMDQKSIPEKFLPWRKLWKAWHRWLADREVSPVHACLAYPLLFSEVDRVVVGADSVNQLAQILSAVKNQIDIKMLDLKCDDEALINPANWNKL
jgi:aryl-alcohol dehydrogenase-like predicted oxidoreductase